MRSRPEALLVLTLALIPALVHGTAQGSPAKSSEVHAQQSYGRLVIHPPDLPDGAEDPGPGLWREQTSLSRSGFTRTGGVLRGQAFIPVLLVEFQGLPAPAHHRPRAYQRMLFQRDYPVGPGSLRDYYLDQSKGLLDVRGAVTDSWMRLPHPMRHYTGESNGYQETEPNDWSLVRDAVRAADRSTDFCRADSNSDGYVDTLFVVHSAPGAEETGKGIWSIKWSLPSPFATEDVCDGRRVKVSDFTIEPGRYRSDLLTHPAAPDHIISIGIFVHELGHVLGLPDLYDTDHSSPGGVGPWDVMAGGAAGFDGASPWRPSPLSAWSKAELGWVKPLNVTQDLLTGALGSLGLGSGPSGVDVHRMAPGGSGTASEYFLLEKHRSRGWGRGSPAGFLIWHVDESRRNNDDDRRRLLHLVQADGRNELGSSADFFEAGDTGDVFPGATNNLRWGPKTSPSSDLYGRLSSGLAVRFSEGSLSILDLILDA